MLQQELSEFEPALKSLTVEVDTLPESPQYVRRKLHALFVSPQQPVLDSPDLARVSLKIEIQAEVNDYSTHVGLELLHLVRADEMI